MSMRVFDIFSVWFSRSPMSVSSHYVYSGLAQGLTK